MTALPIIQYGDPGLRRHSEPVAEPTADLDRLAGQMIETIAVHQGVGLSAPQVGCFQRLIVVDARALDPISEPVVMINPEIIEYSDNKNVYLEGCLSLPEVYAEVKRPDEVTVRYQKLDGKTKTARFLGIPARVIQHEVDHLDGVLFIDRLHPLKRWLMAGRLRRLRKNYHEKETL